MARRTPSRYLPLAIGVALLTLLALLATLQYRWIGQVSELESHHLRATLASSARRFATDFDREVTRAFLYFHPERSDSPGAWRGRVVQQFQRWTAEVPYPRLVRDVLHVHRDAAGRLDVEVLRRGAAGFEPIPWPADLEALRRRLSEPARGPMFGHVTPVVANLPGLLIPIAVGPPPVVPGPAERSGEAGAADNLVVRFDMDAITREILPDLTRRTYGSPRGVDDAVAVVEEAAPGRILFQSDSRLPAALFRSGDVSAPIFGLRPFDELRNLWAGRRVARPRGPAPSGDAGLDAPGGHGHGEAWRLIVRRRHGSLDEAVARIRWHNLGISAGILALLAVTTGLMMVTTQRAQKLARQQIEFVAAVSHELHTPLTAIRSAGQNLADGVVAEPAQVKRYGALIESEGRRLSGMVGQVLDFAGIQSGRQAYTLQPTEVGPLVERALADCRWMLQERRAEVERDVPADLPPVQGDPEALRRALRNLIENAAKYGGQTGGPHPWIRVRARAVGPEIEITVEDRGNGVRREDLPHLFEPFYRGREAVDGSVAGSGLGLSVVRHIAEAHHGRVSVATGGGGEENGSAGCAFTLHLPAGEEAA
ncbi:MAG TPA: HAMP domain-containing sensor histidine kinase [Thermoanaerobaculia bacterium]|jgi:signal transduction histidine kinase